jgi:hypothetical protein
MPNYRGYLFSEDGLIENLSAIFFLISFFLGLIFIFNNNIHRKALIFISAVGLLGFLDELSFGESLFGFNMPRIYGVKIDAVHDFFFLGYKVIMGLTYLYPIYVFLFLGVCIIGVTIVTLKYSYELKETISNIYNKPPFILALFFTILVISALVIDLDLVYHGTLFMVEEVFEMNAAIALLFCCLSLYEQQLPNKPTIRPA